MSQIEEETISEIGVIARAEAARRRRIFAGLLLTLLITCGVVALTVSADLLGPQVDTAQVAQDVLLESNDPQCRTLITGVAAFGERFRTEHAEALEEVIHEDPARVEAARERIKRLRAQADALRLSSREANLVTADSRESLPKWFELVDTELRLLDLRAERHLERLAAVSRGEDYQEPRPARKRKGKIVGAKEAPPRTPQEKRDAAILSLHDAFANFRIWHTAATHPCGPAEPGETPWTPPTGG